MNSDNKLKRMHNTWHKVSRRIDIALWKWQMTDWVAYDYAPSRRTWGGYYDSLYYEPVPDKEWWRHSIGRMRKWNMTCHCGCNRKGRYKRGGGNYGSKKNCRKHKGWNKKKDEIHRFYAYYPTHEEMLYEFYSELEDDYHQIMERRRYDQKKAEIERFGNEHGLAGH